jgi:hypothetical protein
MMMMMMGHEYKIGTTGEITRRRGKEEEWTGSKYVT